jgi:hypothetical protein
MASTTFVNYQTVIDAGWLNDVNSAVYSGTFQASTITPTNVTSSGAISGATVAGTTSVTTPIVKSGTSLSLQTNGTTTAVTIDTSQNVGVGVTPSANAGLKSLAVSGYTGSYAAVSIGASGGGYGCVGYNIGFTATDGTNKALATDGMSWIRFNNGAFQFFQQASATAGTNYTGTQAMTLDNSNNLLVGTTSTTPTSGGLVSYFGAGQSYLAIGHITGTTSGSYYAPFLYNGSIIGGITQNGTTGVLYNLTSDYRLKNNPVPVTGAKDFVMALQPKTWDWWDGSGKGVGFIAHEFMEVAKYSGHGEKDETKQEEYEITPVVKDEQGNVTTPAVMGTRTVPVYQSIQPSSSEVMANLVAYIQELSAEITALKAKVGA